ncbi:acyl-coenzyme A thioesterase 9, mitochondrial-like isoform X2 [Littorina saxatilis]|uniref:acyl-coenzyme A thioesterase 9, mitochondrial-like isoform X2 n=1 Tax=Littorina saxatilis TaxID=31220 RepID=UPI0038B69056
MSKAVIRPLLSLKQLLRSTSCLSSNVSFHQLREVTLSAREVTPITIKQARNLLMDMVGTSYNTDEQKVVKGKDLLPIKSSQEECPVRTMTDSYQEVIIPLGQDQEVRQKYLTSMQGFRFGRILEDMDTFAGLICYTHNQDPSKGQNMKSPLSTVTALVDRIDMHGVALSPFKDVRMCGHVTWVGRSSMEVTMIVEQDMDGTREQVLTARFVMVARNPETKKSAVVNGLKPATEQELALFDLGERKRQLRQEESKKSLLKTAPNEEERNIIHSLFLQTIDQKSGTFNIRVKPENSVWMDKTILKNLRICQPEQKNLYNKIFGGFLMRQAFEMAWANAAIYCKGRPVVQVVDDIVFHRPVEIGSLLFLSSQDGMIVTGIHPAHAQYTGRGDNNHHGPCLIWHVGFVLELSPHVTM